MNRPAVRHSAAKKSGSARPTVGEGDHKYECLHDWGELPANIKYGNTHGVCEDSQGKFVCPHSAAFDDHGNIFVVEWVEVGRVTKLRHVA